MAPAVKNSGKAIASLVCGIVGLIVFGPVLGTIALVMGVLARKETAPVGPYRGRGMATAGIVLGAVDIAFAVIALALGIAAFSFSTYY